MRPLEPDFGDVSDTCGSVTEYFSTVVLMILGGGPRERLSMLDINPIDRYLRRNAAARVGGATYVQSFLMENTLVC